MRTPTRPCGRSPSRPVWRSCSPRAAAPGAAAATPTPRHDGGGIDRDGRFVVRARRTARSARRVPIAKSGSRRRTACISSRSGPLDSGGPLTVAALKSGSIQVGLLFTTSGAIAGNGWVLLEGRQEPPARRQRHAGAQQQDHLRVRQDAHGSRQRGERQDHDRGPHRPQQADRHRPEGPRRRREGVAEVEWPEPVWVRRSPRPARRSRSARRTSPRTRRWPTSTPTCSRPTATR